MSKLGKWITALLVFGLAMFIVIQFVIIPKQDAAAEQYIIDQQRPLTHDVDNIIQYRHPYMGSAGNIMELFYHLPLSDVKRDYELFSDRLTLKINFQQTVSQIGESVVHQSLIYNSTAAFALIGNLEKVEYHFQDEFYEVSREHVESLYEDFDQLIAKKDVWNEKVRNPLRDMKYVEESWRAIQTKEER